MQGTNDTARLLESLGHEVVEDAPQFDSWEFAKAFVTIICGETGSIVQQLQTFVGRKALFHELEPATWVLTFLAKTISASEFIEAKRVLQKCARDIGRFFEKYDVLLTPTLSSPPILTGELQPGAILSFFMKLLTRLKSGRLLKVIGVIEIGAARLFHFILYTPLANVTGQPAMSVPLHWNSQGLPIGMQFIGRYAEEATLFRLAAQLERAKPWFNNVPAVCDKAGSSRQTRL